MRLNFITIHYTYFISISLISSLIIWGSGHDLAYVDALFLAVSAITEAGLNTVNLSSLNTFQQICLFILLIIGSTPWVSMFVIFARKSSFHRKMKKEKRRPEDHVKSMTGWIGMNREAQQLGGYEYRAVCFLSWIVPLYIFLFHLIGVLACGAWVAMNRSSTTYANGLNPWWVGAFNAVSAFNNSGMSLLDANMTAFYDSYYLLITMGFFILAGNTCYPIFLRILIWSIRRISQGSKEWSQTLQFLLDHPRRCYTNLFPAKHTWWLGISVFILNGIDWAAFELLNIGNQNIGKYPIIDGLFQAFAVRSGGFYVVSISGLRIGLLWLYVVMMYISVYPVVITMRNTNVYEERSLGLYAEDLEDAPSDGATSNFTFIRQQLRAQLAHDAWVLAVALIIISVIETSKFEKDPINFSPLHFLFEIVSGYGCVGISMGIPWENFSFCGTWKKSSKLIMCVVMLRGRHRGLPVAIDSAVLLP